MTADELVKLSEPNLTGLNEAVEYAARVLIKLGFKENVEIRITHGYRSIQVQNDLYAQGRYGNPGPIVTSAKGGSSYHNYGLAIDGVLRKSGYDFKADLDGDGIADWMEIVAIAKLLGFEWGGDWISFIDQPHFQMSFGLSISELKAGKKPSQAQINAAIKHIKEIEKRDEKMNEIEVLRNKQEVMSERLSAVEKRLNITQEETYAKFYTDAIIAAKESGLITTSADKSKIELNVIQMFHNIGLTNKPLVDALRNGEIVKKLAQDNQV